MAISTNREKTLEEYKRHIDECAALLIFASMVALIVAYRFLTQ